MKTNLDIRAYQKAKNETLDKFPKMALFFDFIEQGINLNLSGEETPLKSEQQGDNKEK